MDDEPEVLVHISAPTTRANDDLFRSLADAYLAFEPCNEQGDVEGDDELSQSALTRRHSLSSNLELLPQSTNVWSGCDNSDLNDESESRSPIAPSIDSYGSFPSHIPSGGYIHLENSELQESPESSEEASISRLGRLERIHAMWRKQHLPSFSLFGHHGQNGNVKLPAESTFIEDTQEALDALESQLLDHLSTTSEEPSESGADFGGESFRLEPAAEGHLLTSQAGPMSSSQANVNASFQSAVTDYSGPVSASQQSLPASSSQGKVFSEPTGEGQHASAIDFTCLPSMVLPPPPKISVDSPRTLPTQVTKYLDLLKSQNPGRFKPKSISRLLEKDERGHWIVDCGAWPENVQYRLWSSLQRDVGNGNFGWGVTLHREAAALCRELGIVRLFCWGEIVEHMWLSLWLSSEGRIIGTHAVWVDGDEQEVVAMP